MTEAVEINFDGLIGPTHNYGGLSLGNLASAKNAGEVARPKQAALQGLSKMRRLMQLGLPQGILLPQERPHLPTLHAWGFKGSPELAIAAAYRTDQALFQNACAASSMWAANAATVSPSADTEDGRLHLTVANLASNLHRSLEATFTDRQLSLVFGDEEHFAVHDPLPGGQHLGDEGAANHGRLCRSHGEAGVELFVYGDKPEGGFPARQRRRASECIARVHGLSPKRTAFVQQSAQAIDAGAFHNDVVSVANGHVLFAHAQAFEDRDGTIAALRRAFPELVLVEVPAEEVSLADAVRSYLFNSQLVSLPGRPGKMALILPAETQETASTKAYLDRLLASGGPIAEAHVVEVRESMRNGGGPACLRLRVAVTPEEHAAVDQRFLLDEAKLAALEAWVQKTYPDAVTPEMLGDPALHRQSLEALDQLTELLDLGSIYDFQFE
ncbi:N-succinylarginine dihydrolase [Phenylobacterium montanum]|uniref:N-succinylarginine dihydrolase n=1 Tax=Phenylobacterium montanum TaxID=2823693 RepID=A0A975G1B4_9CAUL|nr:N-succinylarginine dihydrolase [Caulobacter sp. S6]QUD88779.1 N-succinylarginine dihydrolase [Caulobacter sp. S6]